MSQYLSEAFKRLDALNEDTFTINGNGLEDFEKFQEEDEFEDTIDVIDPEATSEEELQDSYVGKVILDCCVCHSKIYKDVEDVVIEDDIANATEECPFCYTTDGYKVIGQVAAFGETEDEKDDDKDTDIDDTEDIELDEGLLTEGKLLDNVKKVATRVGADATTLIRCFTELGEIIKNVGNEDEYKTTKLNDWMEHIENKAVLKALMSGNEKVMNGTTKEDIEELAQDVQDYIDAKKAEKSNKDDVNEAVKKVKSDDQESIRKVKMCDVKKGDLIKGNSKDRAFAPSKVIKIEDNGEYINLITKIGNVSGGREDTVDVFDAVNMKSRKADARLLQRKGWNAFDDVEDEGGDFYSVPKKESLEESVNNVNVETDEDVINVATDDSGKVTVTTEPKNTSAEVSEGEEVIAPLEPETQSEISDNVADGEEIEIDMDEFDEESFDELGEGYLKKVYENVNSFKTSNVSFIKNKLVVEGVIKFNSGKSKKTNFIFESREATKSGKVRFIGENKEIARGRKSFTITGKVDNKKFMSESLNYNYGVKGANGKAQRLYGTVRRGK